MINNVKSHTVEFGTNTKLQEIVAQMISAYHARM